MGHALTLLKTLLFRSPWLFRVMRILLGCVFIVAGGSKLLAPRAFARVISAYDLLPEELLVFVALGLPALELLAGLGLLFNIRGSIKTVFALLAGFLLVLAYAILKNLDVDCGCFSQVEMDARSSLRIAFIRDLGLIAISLYLIAWERFHNRFHTTPDFQTD